MRYKLLKDLPGLKAGEYEVHIVGSKLCIKVGNSKSLFELPKTSLEDKDFFEKVEEEERSIHNLKKGDKFYYIVGDEIFPNVFTNTDIDRLISVGDVFLTREEAEKELSKRKARATIKKWQFENDKGEIDWGFHESTTSGLLHLVEKYSICVRIKEKNLCVGVEYENYMHPDKIYYSSEDIATKALKELEKEYKILFDID